MGSFTKLSFKMAAAMLVAACALFALLPLSDDSSGETIDVTGFGGTGEYTDPNDLMENANNGDVINIAVNSVDMSSSWVISKNVTINWNGTLNSTASGVAIVIQSDASISGLTIVCNGAGSGNSDIDGIQITSGTAHLVDLTIQSSTSVEDAFTAVSISGTSSNVTVHNCNITAATGFEISAGVLSFSNDYDDTSGATSLSSNVDSTVGVDTYGVFASGNSTVNIWGPISMSNLTYGMHLSNNETFAHVANVCDSVTYPYYVTSNGLAIGNMAGVGGSWNFTVTSGVSIALADAPSDDFDSTLVFATGANPASGTMVFSGTDLNYRDLTRFSLDGGGDAALYYYDGSVYIDKGGRTASPVSSSPSTVGIYYVSEDLTFSDAPYLGAIFEQFGANADVAFDGEAYTVTLKGDITTTPYISGEWLVLVIDLNGHRIVSQSGAGLYINNSSNPIDITVKDSAGGGLIKGSSYNDGIYIGATPGVVRLGPGFTVSGGDGSDSTSDMYAESGGTGISTSTVLHIDGTTILGGKGGRGSDATGQFEQAGSGGNGGNALLASATVTATGNYTLRGGDGGDGGDSSSFLAGSGGSGGLAISEYSSVTPDITGTNGADGSPGTSGIASGNVTITVLDSSGAVSADRPVSVMLVGEDRIDQGTTDTNGVVVFSIPYGRYTVMVEGTATKTMPLEVTSDSESITIQDDVRTKTGGGSISISTVLDYSTILLVPNAMADLIPQDAIDRASTSVSVTIAASQLTNQTTINTINGAVTAGTVLTDYYDISLSMSIDEGTEEILSQLSGPLAFSIPLPEALASRSGSIVVYTMHGGQVTALSEATDFDNADTSCYTVRSIGGIQYVMIKSDVFSPFAIGYETTQNEPSTPSTSITAEAIDNLIYITITNPQAGREYAVRDAAGALQTSWTSGTGTIRFGPLQPGDTYSVVGRSTVLLRESVDAVFVIPEVPEIIVVAVTAESVTLASEEGVRYILTDADGRTVGRVTGTGSDILWDDLDAGTAYYAEAEVGQGRIILTAGPVLVKPAMDGTVVGDIRHEEAYVYVEGSEGWEYRMDGGAWMSSERIVFGPLSPGIAVLESRETESGITMEKRIDVPTVPTRAESTETSVTITTEEGKTYMLSDVDGASVAGPGGAIWVAGTGGDVTWENLDPAVDYFVHIQTGEGEDAMLFGPETVKLAEEVVQVSGTNEGFSVYITIDNLSPDREYSVAGGDGNPVTEWVTGTPGPVEFGPFEFGATYLVLSREAGSTETLGGLQVEATLVIPEAPDFGSAEYADGVLTMDSVEEWRYQLVDPSGGPVDSGSGIWTDGTGGTLTWTGLDQAGDYFMYAALEDGVLSMSLGPMQVAALVSWTLGDETADVEAASTDKVTIDSVEGSSYMLTDSEGNIAPGPGGQIWVVGTGDALVWTGLDPEKDYSYTIRTVDPETGEVVQSGPHAIPRASEPADPGNPAYALVVAVLIVAYIAFMRLVHREGPFDRRAWLVTAAVLIIAAATGLLYSGIWWQAGITVLAAAAFLSWLYYSDRAAPESRGGS